MQLPDDVEMPDIRNPVYPQKIEISPEVIIRVWEGDYGVPSVDPECLIILTLLKLYNINVNVTCSNFPIIHDIPSLQHNEEFVSRGPELIPYVINKLCREHLMITRLEEDRIELYKKYFLESFAEPFIFDSWLDDSNYAHAIDTWFMNVIPFPFGHKYAENMRKQIKRKFRNILCKRDPAEYMTQRYKAAELCLSDLCSLLRYRKYFINDIPTSLDAVVYSYLTIALHMPLQKPYMQEILKRYPRLIEYVKYITKKHFPQTKGKFKYVERICSEYKPLPSDFIIQTAAIIGSIMVVYAGSIGLIDLHLPNCIKEFNISEVLIKSNFADRILQLLSLPFGIYLRIN